MARARIERLLTVARAPAVALALLCLVAGPAHARRDAPPDTLRTWARAAAGDLAGGARDATVERHVRRLRALVPSAAARLARGSQRRRRAELHRLRVGLARHLEPPAAELRFGQRFFFYTAYQRELERFARLAGLLRTPTGVPQPPAGRPPTPRQHHAAHHADSDEDGVLDHAELDDDGDGVPDGRDRFDSGWGIPDALRAREDWDADADEDGARDRPGERSFSPCLLVGEPIPAFRRVTGARRWLVRAERSRGCHVPRSRESVRPGRPPVAGSAALGGVRLARARLNAAELRVRVGARRGTRLRLVGLRGGRRVLFDEAVRVSAGRRTLVVPVARSPKPGTDVLVVRRPGLPGRARLRLVTGPRPRPLPVSSPAGASTAAQAPPAWRLDTVGPRAAQVTATCQTPGPDSDQDGVSDAAETAGFQFWFYPAGSHTPTPVATTSDPHDANTDTDAVVENGVRYELPDGVEYQYCLNGGVTNPAAADSDQDSLTDVEEVYRWGSTPAAVDSDGDSTGPQGNQVPSFRLYDAQELAGQPQETSPTTDDTDGDSFSDYTELLVDTTLNPRVADLPEFSVAPDPDDPGVEIEIPVSQSQQTITSTFTDEQSSTSFTDQTTNQTVHEHSGGFTASIEGGCGIPFEQLAEGGSCVPFAQGSVSGGAHWVNSTTHTHQTTYSTQSQQEAQKAYQQSNTFDTAAQGTLSATFDVHNSGRVAIQIRELGVLATAECLPVTVSSGDGPAGCLDPGEETGIATLTPVNAPSGITLSAGETQTFQFTATVATPVLQSLLANPGNLSFTPANYELYTPDGKDNYASLIGQAVDSRTGQVTIDYGNGGASTTMVATNVDRAWGHPTVSRGAAPPDVLERVLGIQYETVRNNPPANPRQVLSALNGVRSQPIGQAGVIPATWFAFGSAQGLGDQNVDFDDLELLPGQTLYLAYGSDADGDGLWNREEIALGSSDHHADTDLDQATGPRPDGKGNYASDYFEARVGWKVPYPSANQAYRVYSSPVACDADDDFSPDGPGQGNEQLLGVCPASAFAPELGRTTDPTNRDTNDNGILDGNDPNPLQPPPQPVASGAWTGRQMQATGGQASGESGWSLVDDGQSIAPPELALCGGDVPVRNCANATGYYRLSWTMATAPNQSVRQIAGVWTVKTQNPSDPTPVQWLRANLDGTEVRQNGVDQTYDLYFHIPGTTNMANADLRFTNQTPGPVPVTIERLQLSPVSRSEYLSAALDPNGNPDPSFAAVAFPGQDFAQADGTTDDGPQAIEIDQPARQSADFVTTAWGPPAGFDVPAGGYRAGFQLRAKSNDVEDAITASPSVTTGGTSPTDPEPVAGNTSGLIAPGTNRYALGAAHVWVGDFSAPNRSQVFNVLFDQGAGSQNLSFPVTVPSTSVGLLLDNVVLDVIPDPTNWVNLSYPYSGFAFAGQPRNGEVTFDGNGASFVPPQYTQFVPSSQGAGVTTRTFHSAGRTSQWYVQLALGPPIGGGSPCEDPWLVLQQLGQSGDQIIYPPYQQRSLIGMKPVTVTDARAAVGASFQCLTGVPPENVQVQQIYLLDRPPAPGGVAINRGARLTAKARVQLNIQVPTGATAMQISHRRDFRGARTLKPRRRVWWRLPAKRARRRIYVRFLGVSGRPGLRRVVSDSIRVARRR